MALVIKDPEDFHTKGYNVPKLEDLRLFTAGSDSTDLVERCLVTGRILVSCIST
jgi:U3 small nucleolar RNA-associated protein 4